MPDTRQDEQPLEEVFASIRRLIAEEADIAPKPDSHGQNSAIELTDRHVPDSLGSLPAMRMAPRSEMYEAPPTAVALDGPVPKLVPEPLPPIEASVLPVENRSHVISASAAAASVAVLSKLNRTAWDGASSTHALEAVTRELLKPLLNAWFDNNLPALIERIVRDDIARLLRAARGS